jgi:hypothetical protein
MPAPVVSGAERICDGEATMALLVRYRRPAGIEETCLVLNERFEGLAESFNWLKALRCQVEFIRKENCRNEPPMPVQKRARREMVPVLTSIMEESAFIETEIQTFTDRLRQPDNLSSEHDLGKRDLCSL